MERAKIIQNLKRITEFLPKEYFYTEEEGYNGVPITIIRKNINFVYNVGLWIDSTNSYTQFHSTIYFKQIEDVLNPLLVRNKIIRTYSEENNSTILLKTIEPELFQRTLNPSYPKTIETEQDVLDLLNDLNEYTLNVAEPFYEKWSDLRVLDGFLDTIPQMELVDYLGQGATARKAIVYKLCNNPKLDEYFNWIYYGMVNKYLNDPNGDISNKQLHDLMIDLKEVLDRTKPIYNV